MKGRDENRSVTEKRDRPAYATISANRSAWNKGTGSARRRPHRAPGDSPQRCFGDRSVLESERGLARRQARERGAPDLGERVQRELQVRLEPGILPHRKAFVARLGHVLEDSLPKSSLELERLARGRADSRATARDEDESERRILGVSLLRVGIPVGQHRGNELLELEHLGLFELTLELEVEREVDPARGERQRSGRGARASPARASAG